MDHTNLNITDIDIYNMDTGLNLNNFKQEIDRIRGGEGKTRLRLDKLLSIIKSFIERKSNGYSLSLDKIASLTTKKGETIEKIKIIEANVIIFKNNLQKIESLIKEKEEEILSLRNDYASIMNVSLAEIIKEDKDVTSSEDSADESLDSIKAKRERLLSSMDSMLRGNEERIDRATIQKKDLVNKREDIESKLETAKIQSKILFIAHDSSNNEISRLQRRIKKEARELRGLAHIYKKVLLKIQQAMSLNEENRLIIMHSFLSISNKP